MAETLESQSSYSRGSDTNAIIYCMIWEYQRKCPRHANHDDVTRIETLKKI